MYDRTQNKRTKKVKEIVIKGKTWTIEEVKDLLKRNNKAVERAIKLLYSFQTEAEKALETASTVNGKGFNKFDAEILSSYAEQLLEGRRLTIKQLCVARPKILKYTKQIFNYMLEKNNLATN